MNAPDPSGRQAGVDRRQFLIGAAVVTAGIYVGVRLSDRAERLGVARKPLAPNAFLRIAPDDRITVIIGKSEMGQGVYTSLVMLVAEELDVDPTRVQVEFAPVSPAYNHPFIPMQFTGGSMSIRSSFDQMRKAGAVARAMLIAAAAREWKADPAALTATNGVITDGTRRLRYGELVPLSAGIEPSTDAPLKDPKDFKIIGTPLRRLDGHAKVTGQAQFGLDVQLPGMLTAMVARAPVFGATVQSFDASKARAISGVVDVKQIPTGVAVLATNTWAARRGRDALDIQWNAGTAVNVTTANLREQYRALSATGGQVVTNSGNVQEALAASKRVLEAEYEVPYLAHACMEPLNCVAHVTPGKCEIWTGTQFQSHDARTAAAILGIKPEKVELHTTFLGGGFGRRGNANSDYVSEAVQLAKLVDKPVKIVWTREDDMRGGWYRPFFFHRLRGALDARGLPAAWHHTVVGQSIIADTLFANMFPQKGPDPTSTEGAANLPYAVPNLLVDIHEPKNAVPVQFWRSVGHSSTGFVVNSFLDELAAAAGKDPLEYRRTLLSGKPRHLAVLNLAAEKASWGKPLPAGHAQGLAIQESFGSIVAEVAEVSVEGGRVRVHRVVCAVDCGPVVNPDNVAAQIESGVVYGLSAALHGAITVNAGRVEQGNFNDYPVLRMNEMPVVETHIVPSTGPMGGVGEIGVPCIAPAVCNAIFAATGRRIRRLPVSASLMAS
jgi:isoquinoline 1-oxidoreductase beta subunit